MFVCWNSRLCFLQLFIYFVLLPEFDFTTLASNTFMIFVQLNPVQLWLIFHTNELLINELMGYELCNIVHYCRISRSEPNSNKFSRFLLGRIPRGH